MGKKKEKKEKIYGGARQFFHHVFWGGVAVSGLRTLPGTASLLGDGDGAFLPFIISVCLTLLGVWRIVKYNKAKRQQRAERPELAQKREATGNGFLVPVYLLLIVLTGIAGYRFISISIIRFDREDFSTFLYLLGSVVIALFGTWMLWALIGRIRHIGFYNYWKMYKRFFVDYVPVFVLFLASFGVVSFLCSGIVLLASRSFGEADLITKGFFFFVSKEDNSGSFADIALSAVSGLTGASSYYVLSTFAQESLKEEKRLTLGERILKMLKESDIKKLLIMTVLCLVVGFISGSANSQIGGLFFYGCTLAWSISTFLFMKDTKFIWLALNFCMMLFIDYAVSVPPVDGFGGVVLSVLILAVRILLYSFIAMLIGHDYWLQELRQEAIAADPSLRGKFDGINNVVYNASVLQTTIAAAGVILNGKEIAKGVAEAAKDAALEKIAESIKKHKQSTER